MVNLNCILTVTNFNGLLGSDKEDMQNQNGILTLTSLNSPVGSDNQERQKLRKLDRVGPVDNRTSTN